MLSELIERWVRTFVPVLVGGVVSAVGVGGVDVTAVNAALVGLVITVYYTVAAVLESRWPALGILLGRRKAPTYGATEDPVL